MAVLAGALEAYESEDGVQGEKGGMDPPAKAEKAANDFLVVQQAVPISVRPASANAGQGAASHSQVFSRAGGQRRNQVEPSSPAGT